MWCILCNLINLISSFFLYQEKLGSQLAHAFLFSSVSSVAQSYLTLCDPMDTTERLNWTELTGRVACQGFLVREAGVDVQLRLFSLECNEVSSSEFWGVYGFGVTLGSLYINTQGYVPALLEN